MFSKKKSDLTKREKEIRSYILEEYVRTVYFLDEHIWQELSVKEKSMELKDTEELMESADYVERFKAEYYQTKIRYEKLKKLNTKIEAGQLVMHDSPEYILRNQQKHMGEYLHDLELRAEIEGVML